MLILTQRIGETVMIGEEVTITVLGIKGNQVRVGINAPKSVAVHREEIYERIKRDKKGGASDTPNESRDDSPDHHAEHSPGYSPPDRSREPEYAHY